MLLILLTYRVTPQASTGVIPNMMMLGRQLRFPIQVMYGTPLGPDEEEQTVSEYLATLQDGLRHAREDLQQAVLHHRHNYDGKVQRREYQAGGLVWVHDKTTVPIVRKQDKPLTVIHVDSLEAEQRGCVAI